MNVVPTPSMMLLLTDPNGLDAASETTRAMLEEFLTEGVDCALPLSRFLSVRAVEALTGELYGFPGGLSAQSMLDLSEMDDMTYSEIAFLTRVTERDVRDARLRRAVIPLTLEQLSVEAITHDWEGTWDESPLSHVFPADAAGLDRADLSMFTYRACRRLLEAMYDPDVEYPANSVGEEFILYHACIRWTFPLRFMGIDTAWLEPQEFLLRNSEFLLLFAREPDAAELAGDADLAAAYASPPQWFVPFGQEPVYDD